jgi:carboxymethylenebutenolidase
MIEKETSVVTKHGLMPTFTVRPEGSGPFPAVIFLMDAPGIRQELYEMARRIAARGYYCALPDLYYRLGRVRFDIPRRDERMSSVIIAAMRHIDDERVRDDMAGLLTFLDGEAEAGTDKVGCVGFCMSGRYAIGAAAIFGERFAAAASVYGVNLVSEDEFSPHKLAPKMHAELYMACAEHDKRAPMEAVAEMRNVLGKSSVKHDVEVYPDTHHGYCFSAGNAYAPIAAEKTWKKLFALFDRTLRQGRG